MGAGCLVGADCAEGGEDTACNDDEQQDCCQGDGPGAAAAVVFVFVIFVDAGGFGVRGDGGAVGCVPILGGGDALLVGAGSRDLLVGVGGAAAFGVAEDFGAQCVFCVGECVVFDQQGVQQGVGAGVGGDEVAAAFGGDAQVEDLDGALVASAREFASSSALRLGDATTTETLRLRIWSVPSSTMSDSAVMMMCAVIS